MDVGRHKKMPVLITVCVWKRKERKTNTRSEDLLLEAQNLINEMIE